MHPFITDDTGTQGARNWQLELQAERARHEQTADTGVQQRRTLTLFTPVLAYGLLDNLDVQLGVDRVRQRVTENGVVTEEASGTADTTLELKWRFYDTEGFSLALKPALLLPTGDENRGLGTGKLSWGVNFIATYEAKPWNFFGNVAYTQVRYKRQADADSSRTDLWLVSAGFTYSLPANLRLAGELGTRTNDSRDDPFLPGATARFGMLGLIYSPTDKIDFDIGYRKALNRAEFDDVFLLGATFRW